jgi:hypothetical protein
VREVRGASATRILPVPQLLVTCSICQALSSTTAFSDVISGENRAAMAMNTLLTSGRLLIGLFAKMDCQ